jgi:putative restriction endonuclease
VLQAWDRQCAFCGYDGQLAGASAGIDAAHVRWFNFDGPDDLDNGLALCALHHKLFDLGALGMDLSLRVLVSAVFNARTSAGRAVYEPHGRLLTPRPGGTTPSADHITWHTREVFKGSHLPREPSCYPTDVRRLRRRSRRTTSPSMALGSSRSRTLQSPTSDL